MKKFNGVVVLVLVMAIVVAIMVNNASAMGLTTFDSPIGYPPPYPISFEIFLPAIFGG